jgi:hypothetical protein
MAISWNSSRLRDNPEPQPYWRAIPTVVWSLWRSPCAEGSPCKLLALRAALRAVYRVVARRAFSVLGT